MQGELKRLRLYDNSRLSNFKRCPRYFLYRDEYDWVPERKSMPLIFGSCWHASMDVIWKHHAAPKGEHRRVVGEAFDAFGAEWIKHGLPDPDNISIDQLDEMSPRVPHVAQEMLFNYIEKRQFLFQDPTFELLEIERPFAVPLDPGDDTLWYVGRLDKVFRYRRKIYVGEHKTSSAYKRPNGFRNEFLESWSPNSQIDGYLYAGKMDYGEDFAAVMIDAALVHKDVHTAFEFIEIGREMAQVDSWLYEVHEWIAQVEANRNVLKERSALDLPYLAAFAKNTGSCGNYGGCQYQLLCKGIANPAKQVGVPMGFKKEHWSPFNEVKLETLGFTADRGD